MGAGSTRDTECRNYGVADYAAPKPRLRRKPETAGVSWPEGRTLLFIHGTFSRAQGAFGELPVQRWRGSSRCTAGRVIALTTKISQDPMENIDWLLDTIPAGLSLTSTSSATRAAASSPDRSPSGRPLPGNRKIQVHRTALVGAVNNGTILADVEHWNDLIDSYRPC